MDFSDHLLFCRSHTSIYDTTSAVLGTKITLYGMTWKKPFTLNDVLWLCKKKPPCEKAGKSENTEETKTLEKKTWTSRKSVKSGFTSGAFVSHVISRVATERKLPAHAPKSQQKRETNSRNFYTENFQWCCIVKNMTLISQKHFGKRWKISEKLFSASESPEIIVM